MHTAKTLAGVCYAGFSMTVLTALWLAVAGCNSLPDTGPTSVDFGPLCNPVPRPAGCTPVLNDMVPPLSDGMMPPPDGMMPPPDGMPAAKECTTDNDCTPAGTCPGATKGCKCATNPMSATGKSCAPACTVTADCPMGAPLICDTAKGICIPR